MNSVTLVGLVVLCCLFVTSAYAGNDYLWGEIGPNDYQLAKDTVSKAFFLGLVQTKKYVFKQSVRNIPQLFELALYLTFDNLLPE